MPKKVVLSYGIANGTLTGRDSSYIEEKIDENDPEGEKKAKDEAKARMSHSISFLRRFGYWLEWSEIKIIEETSDESQTNRV